MDCRAGVKALSSECECVAVQVYSGSGHLWLTGGEWRCSSLSLTYSLSLCPPYGCRDIDRL